MKNCIKLKSFTSEEPPLTVGNPPEMNEAWITWCRFAYNCTREEAIHRWEVRVGKHTPKRKFKP